MNTQGKSLGYTLFVDEEMDELFHVFCALFGSFDEFTTSEMTREEMAEFKDRNKMDKTKETFLRFLKATEDPSHELGWCKDPTCSWVPKEKRK